MLPLLCVRYSTNHHRFKHVARHHYVLFASHGYAYELDISKIRTILLRLQLKTVGSPSTQKRTALLTPITETGKEQT